MMKKRKTIQPDSHRYLQLARVENYSGWEIQPIEQIPPLRRGYYNILNFDPGGEAPKDFIRLYQYGITRRNPPGNWTTWIAKVGHKWHPVESVMEYLFSRLGEVLGFTMAESCLMRTGQQLRFLSKYFLRKREQLIHGAEIYGGFLSDRNLVEQVEKEKLARDLFTFQFAENAIKGRFTESSESLMRDFVKMLVFDAIVSNMDRHFYNWGIISIMDDSKLPRFAPIYDTARGLFWNHTEQKINEKLKSPDELNQYLENYIKGSAPKTGWEGEKKINHFRLIERIYENGAKYRHLCNELVSFAQQEKALQVIDAEFGHLLSPNRLILIKACLKMRFQKLQSFNKNLLK